jgi:CRISPR-associated protein Cmr3
MIDLLLLPRDPIVARTASPFTSDPGARAATLDWPLPSTFAGALRTHIGNAHAVNWKEKADVQRIAGIAVRGGLLIERAPGGSAWIPYLPAPRDAFLFTNSDNQLKQIRALRPHCYREGEGSDLPSPGDAALQPILIEDEEKPDTGYDFWSFDDTVDWLCGAVSRPKKFRGKLPKETRTHVTIQRETQTARPGHLFSTSGIVFGDLKDMQAQLGMLCQANLPPGMDGTSLPSLLTFGGEKRQVRLERATGLSPVWTAPEQLIEQLTDKKTFRLQLVTPAFFRTGWYPGWLTQKHKDRIPEPFKSLGATLQSAIVDRRVPVSGWDFRHDREKPLRYAAPAGSVYFLETAKPLKREQIESLWMQPVSDAAFDRQDGFGLAVPGVWLNT